MAWTGVSGRLVVSIRRATSGSSSVASGARSQGRARGVLLLDPGVTGSAMSPETAAALLGDGIDKCRSRRSTVGAQRAAAVGRPADPRRRRSDVVDLHDAVGAGIVRRSTTFHASGPSPRPPVSVAVDNSAASSQPAGPVLRAVAVVAFDRGPSLIEHRDP
jgi:hypothetical protein